MGRPVYGSYESSIPLPQERSLIVESLTAHRPGTSVPPQLLVSVRNAAEAALALEGGAHILDVKEPTRGPLGMADPAAISAIVTVRDQYAPLVPVSVALGEVLDWDPAGTNRGITSDPVSGSPAYLASGLAFFKLGTAGLGRIVNWTRHVEIARSRAGSLLVFPDDRENLQWILVAYADWRAADAPAPQDVLAAASELGFHGVLIDTCTKQGKSLLEWLTAPELRELGEAAAGCNLSFALAGQLRSIDLPRLRDVPAALVGIRSAACIGGRRDGEISPTAIRAFRQAQLDAWGSSLNRNHCQSSS